MKSSRASSRGLSLVESMIGLLIGLLVVGLATSLLLAHLQDARRLVRDARLAQDLSDAATLTARELRRSSHWHAFGSGVVRPGGPAAICNPHAPPEISGGGGTLTYHYDGPHGHHDGSAGLRLRDGAIEMRIGEGGWQAVTDPDLLKVTRFQLTPIWDELSLAAFCQSPCEEIHSDCPPRQRMLSVDIVLEAHQPQDSTVAHRIQRRVLLRNGGVDGHCAG